MIAANDVRIALKRIALLAPLSVIACDGGMSSLFEKRYSIAEQVAASEKAAVFTPTTEPTRVDSVKVNETSTLSLTPMFTVGDGRDGHALLLVGTALHVLPLRDGRMAIHDRADKQLHILDSAGRWLSSQPAHTTPPDLISTVLGRQSYFDDLVSRGDTIIALSTNYTRGAEYSLSLLVGGKPELTAHLAELSQDRTTGESNLIGVSESLETLVHKVASRSGVQYFSRPRHSVLRVPTRDEADSTTQVLRYTRADSLLSFNDGGEVVRPIFGSAISAAFSDSLLFVARDTTPRIEVFDFSGAPVRTVVLDLERVPTSPEVFARRRDAFFDYFKRSMDTAVKTALAKHPYPAQQPVIAALVASPDGQLLVLRDDLGWDAPKDEQRHVFDIFDASFGHVGRGSLDRAHTIKLFKPPVLCTSHYQPLSAEEERAIAAAHAARPGLVTCYRITTPGTAPLP